MTKLVIRSEHLRMLHAGPTLLATSLNRRFHIVYLHKTVRSITRQCITCHHQSIRPQPQMKGQLPLERVTPECIFEEVGVRLCGSLPHQVWHGTETHCGQVLRLYFCLPSGESSSYNRLLPPCDALLPVVDTPL